MEDYLKAKKDIKRDLIIFLAFAFAMSIIVMVLIGTLVNNLESFNTLTFSEKILVFITEMFSSLFIGVVAATVLPGWILSFRFVWRKVGLLSVLLVIVAYAVGAMYGWLITTIYFVRGHSKIKKLKKALSL